MKSYKLNPKNIILSSEISLDFDIPQFQFTTPEIIKDKITVYTGNKKEKSKSLF